MKFATCLIRGLVTTDVASRGLDIPDVDIVICYEPPDNSLTHVHRVGRTGRYGKKGKAITFFTTDKEDAALAPDVVLVMDQTHQQVSDELRQLALSCNKTMSDAQADDDEPS